jgi:hypothetical protein
MNKHLKTSILKALGFTIIMGFIFYTLYGNYDGFEKDLKTVIMQSAGSGILFGIIIYLFDRPKKED